jgi:hypothetical protein
MLGMLYLFSGLVALVIFYVWLMMKWPPSMLPVAWYDLFFNVPLIWKAIRHKEDPDDIFLDAFNDHP